MKICYFGFYNPEYSRNHIFLKALKSSDSINITEVNAYRDRKLLDHRTKGLSLYPALAKEFFKKRPKGGFDRIIVGYSDYSMVPLAKLLAPRTPIINDFFYSQYNTAVHDRKKTQTQSWRAWVLWIMDWVSLHLPDEVIVDTDTHGEYYCEEFDVDSSKLNTIYVSTDTDVFYPRKRKKGSNKFIVHFHGKYIPLQGVMKILEAARILKDQKDIEFCLIGKGQQYSQARKFVKDNQLQNVVFKDIVPYKELPEFIFGADVVLGIFGDSEKAKTVIPNKVFEGAACGKPVITRDSSAARELFTHKENILLVSPNAKKIASTIIKIKDNKELANSIADNAEDFLRSSLGFDYFSKELNSVLD